MKKARNAKKDAVISELFQDTKKVKKLERKKPKKNILLLVLGIILCCLIGMSWWYILSNQSFNDSGIVVSIDKEVLSSGVTSDFIINYKNNTGKTLSNATLRIKAPQNLIISKTTPQSEEEKDGNTIVSSNLSFNLGTLQDGDTGKITLQAALFAQRDTVQSFDIYFDYRPENFNADFQKKISSSIRTEKIPYSITIDAPSTVEATEEFTTTATITFNELVANQRIFSLSPQFTVTTSTPELIHNEVALINTTTPQKITIKGIFHNQEQTGNQESEASILANLPNQKVVETTTKISQVVTAPQIIFTTSLENKKSDGIFGKDESITLSSTIHNNATTPQKNIGFDIDLAVPFVQQTNTLSIETPCTVKQPKSNTAIKKVTISCSAKNIAELKELAGGKSIALTHTIAPLKNAIHNAPIIITPHLITPSIQNGEVITITLRNDATFTTKISSNNEMLRTFDTDGITEIIKRTYHLEGILTPKGPLADVELRIPLPENITLEPLESPRVGELQYIAATNTLLYTANTLSTDVPEIPISFSFSTITSLGDTEKKIVSDSATLQAADTISKTYFSKKLDPILIP